MAGAVAIPPCLPYWWHSPGSVLERVTRGDLFIFLKRTTPVSVSSLP